MIGLQQISASRLLAVALLSIGCALMLAPAPATAQEQTPWYLPQPWVSPPLTGPKIHNLYGTYGAAHTRRDYGSFAVGCYGLACYSPGTIVTGNGVVLYNPALAAYDQNGYEVVPRGYYRTRTVYVPVVQRSAMANPRFVHATKPAQKKKVLPQYTMQNGVRIIRPAPLPAN
jgi:hypothetical protein